ncbi:MAG: trigger factor [Candidatus Sumerlaeaceae bacterium]|nr:trigger factor [Candidatus Sumerlaeaceae bacterium]
MTEEKQKLEENSAEQPAEKAEASVLEEATRRVREQQEVAVSHTIVSEQELPQSRRMIVVEIAADEWTTRLDELFKDFQQNVALEGFRKGKAPLKLLQRRFMREAQESLAEKLVPAILKQYAEAKQTTLYGTPRVLEIDGEPGRPARLQIEVEVKPELNPTGYEAVSVEVEDVPVPPDLVERELEALRFRNAFFEQVDRPADANDGVVVDYKAVNAKGQTVDEGTDVFVHAESNAPLPDEVRAAVVGKKAGDEFEVEAAAPDGSKVKYVLNVKAVKQLRVPELDDEFAKDLGYENLEKLRQATAEMCLKRIEAEKMDRAFDAIVKQLADANDFEVPPSLQAQVERDLMHRDLRFMYATGRLPWQLRGQTREEYRLAVERDANLRVKGYLLLDAIGTKENIEATPEDIDAALQARAAAEGRKPLAVRAALEKARQWESFVEEVRFDKIREYILSKAKITWVAPKAAEDAQPATS